MSINDKLDEIEARVEAASEGPWEGGRTTYGDPTDGPTHVCIRQEGSAWTDHLFAVEGHQQAGRDAAFIAHARTDVPWLVEQVKVRDKALDAVLALLDATEQRGSLGRDFNGRPFVVGPSLDDLRAAITEAFESDEETLG